MYRELFKNGNSTKSLLCNISYVIKSKFILHQMKKPRKFIREQNGVDFSDGKHLFIMCNNNYWKIEHDCFLPLRKQICTMHYQFTLTNTFSHFCLSTLYDHYISLSLQIHSIKPRIHLIIKPFLGKLYILQVYDLPHVIAMCIHRVGLLRLCER